MKKRHLDIESAQVSWPNALDMRGLSRRAFVLRGSAALAATTALSGIPLVLGEELIRETGFSTFSEKEKKIVSAVQIHLFPKDVESPGALDI